MSTFAAPDNVIILLFTKPDEVEEVNAFLSRYSTVVEEDYSFSSQSSIMMARSVTISRLLAVVLHSIQMTANIVYAMLQSIKENDHHASPPTGSQMAVQNFPFSLVQKCVPVVNDLLPLYVNLCAKIVQSWETAQSVRDDLISLKALHDVQEKTGSRPSTSHSHRNEDIPAVSVPTKENSLVWFDVDQSYLYYVLVESAVLMGTIMSLPSMYANIAQSGSQVSLPTHGISLSKSYSLNATAPVPLNVLTMSDRW